MIPKELEAKILRLYAAEHWKIGTLAQQLGVHHSTVTRVLRDAGVLPVRLSTVEGRRASKADPYVPFIIETLEKYPDLTSSRLYAMVTQRGYVGSESHFRSITRLYRPKPIAEAYLRLRTLPGEQAQVDWGHFGTAEIGRATRRLSAFVMVLSWSRRPFLRFFYDQRMSSFLQGHVAAFEAFGGVPRVALYDNLKSAVLERIGDAIRFHPTLLELASHYHFEPRPVAVARGNEKGRVERLIRYVRDNFFCARQWTDLDDLNAQADFWCRGKASQRPCPEDHTMTVGDAFGQERPRLMPLPNTPFPAQEHIPVSIGKTPYARFDLNDYSVPPTYVRRTLTLVATTREVRILDGQTVVAEHARSYDKGKQVEDERHIESLVAYKRQARKHRAIDRLRHAVPNTEELLTEVAQSGANLGSATAALMRMLNTYGAVALEQAVAEALASGSPHPNTVRRALERDSDHQPIAPVALPNDERINGQVVKPHSLADYDMQEGCDE